ncbi:IclR family transcriptional regulator [Saccharopolyspora phatthalungensis]|uniref:DNA-binding IclR family transcriptional regulator n=1 Tax=Saccharopolyspora phatthalungensis TaxID=664693 RepID=A0A840QH48_9PSEU|nr:IclR family transcriptional regulator C-terminal domain-containing protein [Saccharopolyspora phatthalungensis]MBB5159451.1 DNA-binding IclR family transcriptional regulator [Saccharopolyspora phatthalungensis]
MKNKPAYGIDSVDHALHLATLLQQEGPLRVTDAAQRLGVARSTAHRLLAMLVYRDFAEQDEDRRYVAGSVLRRHTVPEPVADLRRIALPHLQSLVARTDETSNLLVVVADQVRFAATVECGQVLRVGDREGKVLPAHLASGGRAVLATRSEAEIRELYGDPDSGVADVDALLRDLRRVRRQGFAMNDQKTEVGVTALGCAVAGPAGAVPAAVSLAMPTARYRRERLGEWVRQVTTTAERISKELGAVL